MPYANKHRFLWLVSHSSRDNNSGSGTYEMSIYYGVQVGSVPVLRNEVNVY